MLQQIHVHPLRIDVVWVYFASRNVAFTTGLCTHVRLVGTTGRPASQVILQFGVRMQHMVASASSVLLDVNGKKGQIPRETPALRKAMDLGQTRPLESLMHRTRYLYSHLPGFAAMLESISSQTGLGHVIAQRAAAVH